MPQDIKQSFFFSSSVLIHSFFASFDVCSLSIYLPVHHLHWIQLYLSTENHFHVKSMQKETKEDEKSIAWWVVSFLRDNDCTQKKTGMEWDLFPHQNNFLIPSCLYVLCISKKVQIFTFIKLLDIWVCKVMRDTCRTMYRKTC